MSSPAAVRRGHAVRVLLVDDHTVVRLGLRTLLDAEPDITVVGEAGGAADAVRECERLAPDVVVMDLSMDGGEHGIEATRAIVARAREAELARGRTGTGTGAPPPPRVLVLTMHAEEEYLVPVLDAGAAGYVVKDAASRDLVTAVRTVYTGRVYVRPAAAPVLAGAWARREERVQALTRAAAPYETLSERERAVFRLFALGHSPAQIGERLFVSPKTVDTYKRRINEKLGLADRADYVRLALALGLLTPDAADS